MIHIPVYLGDNKPSGRYQVCTYDAWNRMVKVETDDATPDTLAAFEYDAVGRRIVKAVTNAGDLDATYQGPKQCRIPF